MRGSVFESTSSERNSRTTRSTGTLSDETRSGGSVAGGSGWNGERSGLNGNHSGGGLTRGFVSASSVSPSGSAGACSGVASAMASSLVTSFDFATRDAAIIHAVTFSYDGPQQRRPRPSLVPVFPFLAAPVLVVAEAFHVRVVLSHVLLPSPTSVFVLLLI